jgi:hypothetical protein
LRAIKTQEGEAAYMRGKRTLNSAFATFIFLGSVIALDGCSGDDDSKDKKPGPEPEAPSATVDVNVGFVSENVKTTIATLHMWVVASRTPTASTLADAGTVDTSDKPKLGCSSLVGGLIDPYDLSVSRRADLVASATTSPLKAERVGLGQAFVYVEGVNYVGEAELAGCAPIDVIQPSATASVSLSKAGVVDCTDPAAEDGAPCDDGMLCTVGEKCDSGKCKGGAPRACDQVADDCNAGTCDEVKGCVPLPLADKTPCDDGLFCTSGDTCTAGVCGGVARDCTLGAPACKVPASCDERSQRCVYQNAPTTTPCDDGKFCTSNDMCNSIGTCVGTLLDCTAKTDQCNTGTCDEITKGCIAQPRTSSTICNDQNVCTTTDRCNGLGACVGLGFASTLTTCNDLNLCTDTDKCDGAGKCGGTPVLDRVCDDANATTTGDKCDALGVCKGI